MRRWFANLARCVPALVVSCVVLWLLSTVLSAQQPVPPPAPQSPPADRSQAPAPPAAPKNRPPFPNRFNEVMPPWLRVRGEFRERAEGFVNSGFVDGRDDLYYLSRFRFNATAASKPMAATVQLQDARVGNKTVGATGTPSRRAIMRRLPLM